jgi:predicted amidophosphoribosyltransferase
MLDLIFPNVCAGCDRPSRRKKSLCGECLSEVRFLSEFSSCIKCGTPFGFFNGGEEIGDSDAPSPAGESHLCGKCLRGGFRFVRVRSALLYDGKIRDMIHEFKYRGRLDLEGVLSCLMLKNFHYAAGSFDVTVPVPLHLSKLREREYNQSAVLAYNLVRGIGIKCDMNALKKVRDVRSSRSGTRMIEGRM